MSEKYHTEAAQHIDDAHHIETTHHIDASHHIDVAHHLKKLRKAMKEVQSSKRFEHTLGVEYTAAALAMRYGASVENALLAGLLHDCAKCLSDEELFSLCKKHGLDLSETEKRNPSLLHSKVGAYLAEHKYGIKNQDIINAIRSHTTGRPEMSLLEKIVFVADYMEPGRNHAPNLSEIRKLAFEDINKALLIILENTLAYLDTTGEETDPLSRETLNFYKGKVG